MCYSHMMHPKVKIIDPEHLPEQIILDEVCQIEIEHDRLVELVGTLTDNSHAFKDGQVMAPTAPGPMQWVILSIDDVAYIVEHYDITPAVASVRAQKDKGHPSDLRKPFLDTLDLHSSTVYEHNWWGTDVGLERVVVNGVVVAEYDSRKGV